MRTRRRNSSMHRAEPSASAQTPLVLCIFTASPREIKIYCMAWPSPRNRSPGVLQPAWPRGREHRPPARSTAQRPRGNGHCKGQGSAGTLLQTGGWWGARMGCGADHGLPTTSIPPKWDTGQQQRPWACMQQSASGLETRARAVNH